MCAYLHALVICSAGNVHRERDKPADEGHKVLPQVLGRFCRLVTDQLLRGDVKDHLEEVSIDAAHQQSISLITLKMLH